MMDGGAVFDFMRLLLWSLPGYALGWSRLVGGWDGMG